MEGNNNNKKSDNKKAYPGFFGSGVMDVSSVHFYEYYDIDADGIPELLICDNAFRTGSWTIGKVVGSTIKMSYAGQFQFPRTNVRYKLSTKFLNSGQFAIIYFADIAPFPLLQWYDGNSFQWKSMGGNTAGLGNITDFKHYLFWGPPEPTSPNTILPMHYVDDGNWWNARYVESTNTLQWNRIGNTQGQSGSPYNFGNLGDGHHYTQVGDFDGDGLNEVITYFDGDGNWYLGKFVDTSQTLEWKKIGNTRDGRPYDFGKLFDGHHYMLIGRFERSDRESVIFNNEGDGNC
jgi:hypothetical protein